jgi:UDP-N-acetylmuramoyl-L-alanyl-D-glutamate--2,6-diaminopimelate ligase
VNLTVAELARRVPGASVRAGADARIAELTHDSREVRPGWAFVAVPGARVDGRRFISQAVERGASAVIGEADCAAEVPTGTPWIEVGSARAALGLLAAAVHGEPARSLCLVGVTGTNGKTTTTTLVHGMARCAGWTPGLIGTVEHRIGATVLPARHTTPEAPELHRLLAGVRDAGGRVVAMEVSSIGLVEHRLDGLEFDVVAFTNLTPDHLDHHGTMEAYGDAKVRLFTEHVKRNPTATWVVNVDDAFGRSLVERAPSGACVWTVSVDETAAALHFVHLTHTAGGLAGTVRTPMGDLEIETTLFGRFNASNVLVAIGCALGAGLPADAVVEGLRHARVRGRLERAGTLDTRPVVLVDYAHTADALERVLEALRSTTDARLVCVFGCGGDRDPSKRGPMGRAAAAADAVIVTTDNPRGESPEQIAAAAAEGAAQGGRPRTADPRPRFGATWVELDRASAIRAAIELAADDDVVLIAGKGHETYQEVHGVRTPFDDLEVAAAALAARGRRA